MNDRASVHDYVSRPWLSDMEHILEDLGVHLEHCFMNTKLDILSLEDDARVLEPELRPTMGSS